MVHAKLNNLQRMIHAAALVCPLEDGITEAECTCGDEPSYRQLADTCLTLLPVVEVAADLVDWCDSLVDDHDQDDAMLECSVRTLRQLARAVERATGEEDET